MLIHADPVSYECVISARPLCSCVVREMKTMSAAARWHQVLLFSFSRSKKRGQCSVSRRAYRNRHGCELPDEGAQCAASNKVSSSVSASDSPDMARGDHRSRKRASIG